MRSCRTARSPVAVTVSSCAPATGAAGGATGGARERRRSRARRRGRRGRGRELLRAQPGRPARRRRATRSGCRSGAAGRRATRCRTPGRRASGRALPPAPGLLCGARERPLRVRPACSRSRPAAPGPSSAAEDVFALAGDAAQVVEAGQGLVERLRAEARSRAARRSPARRASAAGGRAAVCADARPALARSRADATRLARSARSESACGLQRGDPRLRAESCSSSEYSWSTAARYFAASCGVLRAQRRSRLRRSSAPPSAGTARTTEGEGGERRAAPTRRVCLPKHGRDRTTAFGGDPRLRAEMHRFWRRIRLVLLLQPSAKAC